MVDVQNDFAHEGGKAAALGADVIESKRAVESINRLINGARNADVPVFYLRTEHSTQTDKPNYIARYEKRGLNVDDLLCAPGSWGAQFYEGLLLPTSADHTITKYGYDGFQDTELQSLLEESGVSSLILTGLVTNLCVQTTAEHGFGLGYSIVIASDATAGDDQASHEAALRNLGAYFGLVVRAREVLAEWSTTQGPVSNHEGLSS